jgi:8-oxo-dGTP pyrophosphatase MutT (NUDIX family)/phosphohistidine phosphatase SixA
MALKLVRAAGGLVTRERPDGPDVALVHRPAYDDWSFPKGKLEPGEDEAAAAVREVAEETGLTLPLGRDLGTITYVDSHDRPKVVRYWHMPAPVGADLVPRYEIDDARWFSVAAAERTLTYAHDRRLLLRFTGEPVGGAPVPVYLIRHVEAGERAAWRHEPDELRPISESGRRHAARIAASLAEVAFTRLVASPYLRCVQTLEPFADAHGLDIAIAPELNEGQLPAAAEAWVFAAAADGPAALSTHGDIVEGVVRSLLERDVQVGGDGHVAFAKGGVWRLDVLDGRVRRMTYLPPTDEPTPD